MNEERSTRHARGPRVRRTTAVALATTVGIGLLVPAVAAAAAGFPDVPADSPHAGAIQDLADREVVRGKADGTYGVGDLLTRGQLASMLARADGLAPKASGPFTDVSGPHAGAINALAERGIIEGKGDGRFDPNGTIKRDQVASMIARYLELAPSSRTAFGDVPADSVHVGAINALAAVDVARGSDGRYQPRRDLRRDQAASFVSRGLAYAEGRPGPGPGPDPAPAPDCPDLDAPVPGTATGSEVSGFTPTITVSDTRGLAFGDTITVTGSGFDPASNVGTRPPLSGQAAGVYVVFGNFAEDWRPSESAPGSARSTSDTKWVLPTSATPAPPFGETQQAQRVDLAADGSFTTTLEVLETASAPGGADGYGVFVYPGSGASNADHELEVRTSVRGDVEVDLDIEWGVKRSFRDYIAGPIAAGTISTTGAVTQAAGNGAFTWDAEGLVVGGDEVARSTDGVVTFSGHGGLLHVELSDLQVVLGDDEATLFADVCSRSLQGGEDVGYADVHLADLTLDGAPTEAGDVLTYAFGAVLAETGVEAFADFYEAGEELDQLLLHVDVAP